MKKNIFIKLIIFNLAFIYAQDYTYSLQQLQINENTYVQNEFMKQNNFQWLKRIIENIFEIQITKNFCIETVYTLV